MDVNQIRRSLGERDSPQVIKLRQSAMDAVKAFEKHPDFPRIHLAAMRKARAEYKTTGKQLPDPLVPSTERLGYELKILDIWAEAYVQFVSDLDSHKQFTAYLRGLAQNAWERYRGIAPVTPNKNNVGSEEIAEHTAHWEEESWERVIAAGREAASEITRDDADPAPQESQNQATEIKPSIAERLDEAVAQLDITHDELARRIPIGKTTYYAVKGGGGKRSSQLKVQRYLDKLNKTEQSEQKRTNPNS